MKTSGGGKPEWGEGGLGGREKVEDADELVEVVVELVDDVEIFGVSIILLALRVTHVSLLRLGES